MTTTTYFAYGSNLDPVQMQARCPSATPLGTARLAGWGFRISQRGYATIEAAPSEVTWGALWRIADDEITDLDYAEGVHVDLYVRAELDVITNDGAVTALVYIDRYDGPGEPRVGYLERVLDGAHHFDLPLDHQDHIASFGR